ncbi:MAG TPA: type II CAAX endopeptidase family protein [Pyrinomonadaceae bacterium]|nr:type II CAAX endopeptidase family protein [Pyrinomonadaceae bacterium]
MELRNVFINSAGRLRSGWRLLIFLLVYIALLFFFGSVSRIIYVMVLQIVPSPRLGTYLDSLLFRLTWLAAALVAGLICTRWLEGLPFRAIGLWLHKGWLRDLLVGSGIGIASLALATGIAAAGGGLTFRAFARGELSQVVKALVASAVLFVIAALAEEVFARGYPLQTMSRAGLAGLGVVITSVAFAGLHFANPNFSKGLPLVNLILAGVWFAVAYLRTRSLWFPLGIHWAWNWALGSLFGLPVSGKALVQHSLFHGTDWGPAWLTGGDFGIEGGIACTITLILSTIFIWRTKLISATEEMKRLTSQENPVVTSRSEPPA